MNKMYLLSCMTSSRVSQAPSPVREFDLSFERIIEVTGKLETFHEKGQTILRRQRSLIISPLIVSTLESSSRGVKPRRECVHGKFGKFRE